MSNSQENDVSDLESGLEHEEAAGEDQDQDSDMMAEDTKHPDDSAKGTPDVKITKLDPKDPLRPRRKKARRACFACQRAHLTCGDERPCQRCIKRGLADACQDGVRKKAKYLHDAPPDALRPVLGPSYNVHVNARNNGPMTGGSTSASESSPNSSFYPAYNGMTYQSGPQNTMPPPISDTLMYNNQPPQPPPAPSPLSPSSFSNNGSIRILPIQNLTQMANNPSNMDLHNIGGLYEASHPQFFNFDVEGLNFGNHYGALEFEMLNHMSSGAAETPPHDHNGAMAQTGDSAFMSSSAFNTTLPYGSIYEQQDMKDFMDIEVDRPNNVFDIQRSQSILPRAYAINTHNSGSVASPSTNGQPSPGAVNFELTPSTLANYQSAPQLHGATGRPARRESKQIPKINHQSLNNAKPRRDPSSIYTSVTEPYAYTAGFHALTAFIQKRFSAAATLRIAKSLASIRPSFIACTKTLTRQDLIFMEQCFQRTLFEYQDFMRDCSTPTLVCRRTGEVAAVNSEFTSIVGWKEDVLLGKKINLNINTGRSGSVSAPPSMNNSGRAGLATPRNQLATDKVNGRPRSVFLAELMDDDSVVEFYEDFAKLAFGDSRGSIMKRCKLLKYRPKEGLEEVDEEDTDDAFLTSTQRTPPRKNKKKRVETVVPAPPILGGRVKNIDGKDGIVRLVKEDGKLDCTYCWTVKRDVFDIPMLFVMNVRIAGTLGC